MERMSVPSGPLPSPTCHHTRMKERRQSCDELPCPSSRGFFLRRALLCRHSDPCLSDAAHATELRGISNFVSFSSIRVNPYIHITIPSDFQINTVSTLCQSNWSSGIIADTQILTLDPFFLLIAF